MKSQQDFRGAVDGRPLKLLIISRNNYFQMRKKGISMINYDIWKQHPFNMVAKP